MRSSGRLESVIGYGRSDHLCLGFDDPTEFDVHARAFLADGLRQGLQVQWVRGQPCDAGVRERLRDQLPNDRPDAVRVDSLYDAYGPGQSIMAEAQMAFYDQATENALEAGFAGLRVAVDATVLVVTSAQRDAFARYEHMMDRYMVGRPFSAMCAYDRTTLGTAAVAELACMHPVATADTAFRWHAMGVSNGFGTEPATVPVLTGELAPSTVGATWATEVVEMALAGEIDRSVHDAFATALRRLDLRPGGLVVVDTSGVEFIDHRAMLELDDLGRRLDTQIALRNPSHGSARMVQLLDLDNVVMWEAA